MQSLLNPESLPFLIELAIALGSPLCVLDLETTGYGNHESGIVQIGMLTIGLDGRQAFMNVLVNPRKRINPFATRVHGLTFEDVRHSPEFKTFAPRILMVMHDHVLCGYNSSSCDIPVLRNNLAQLSDAPFMPKHLDVRKLWINISRAQKGKLTEVAARYGVTPGQAHDAMGDVLTTARLLDSMIGQHGMNWVLEQYESMKPQVLSDQGDAVTTDVPCT